MAFTGEPLAVELLPVEVESYIADFFGEVSLPATTISAVGGSAWFAEITLPAITFYGGTSLGWNTTLDVPSLDISATGTASSTATGAATFPKLKINATAKRSGAGAASFPSLTISASGFTAIDWDSPALVLPQITVEAFAESVLAAVFETWCLNMTSAGVSEYTSFPITSAMRFNGKYYGTTATGIFELTGDTDAATAIAADVLTGVTDYSYEGEKGDNSLKIKRSGGAYVNLRSQGGFAVVAKVDEDTERIYTLTAAADPKGFHPRRVDLGRLLEGRNWQFGFKNVAGADFSVRDFQNIPIVLSRRI